MNFNREKKEKEWEKNDCLWKTYGYGIYSTYKIIKVTAIAQNEYPGLVSGWYQKKKLWIRSLWGKKDKSDPIL